MINLGFIIHHLTFIIVSNNYVVQVLSNIFEPTLFGLFFVLTQMKSLNI